MGWDGSIPMYCTYITRTRNITCDPGRRRRRLAHLALSLPHHELAIGDGQNGKEARGGGGERPKYRWLVYVHKSVVCTCLVVYF